ncbi:MAG: hypothetical protein AB1782_13125 [Cyanobacteriota bacterium]
MALIHTEIFNIYKDPNCLDSICLAKEFSYIAKINHRKVLRLCKKRKIQTEIIGILGINTYLITIDELDGKLRRRYLTNLYKQYGIDTKDLKTARLQYHSKLIWGTTDLSLKLDELVKLQANKTKENKEIITPSKSRCVINDVKKMPELIALARLKIITDWLEYRFNSKREHINYEKADKLFLNSYHESEKYCNERNVLSCIGSVDTLRRWKQLYFNSNKNWRSLIPNYKWRDL